MSLANKHNTHPAEKTAKRKRYQKVFSPEDKTLTVQSDRDRCDVNCIMAKYRRTGLIDHVNAHQGRYGDFTTATDFQEAMNVVAEAQQSFDLLPAEIRKKFDNNPKNFLEFVADPENAPQLIKMGLATEPEKPAEPPVAAPKQQAEGGSAPPQAE